MTARLAFPALWRRRSAIALAIAMLAPSTGVAGPIPPTVYCVPNEAAQACVRLSLSTTTSGGTTTATLRLSNLEGTAQPGITPVAWARLHTVELLARGDGSFAGGDPQGEAPITLEGAILESGDGPPTWTVVSITEPGAYVGYAVSTDMEHWGAEIVGCSTPAELSPPYYQTCGSGGTEPGDFVIRFTTAGTWDASQVGIVIGLRDDVGETGCSVTGSLWTSDLPLCVIPGASSGNQAPTALVGGPYQGTEGSSIALALGGSDPDGDALSYSWDFGDGHTGSTAQGDPLPAGHVYPNDGAYTLTLTVSDGKGGQNSRSTSVTVANAPPAVGALTVPLYPVQVGSAVMAAANFTDPGTADTHTGTVLWDIGATPAQAMITEANGAGTVSANSSALTVGVHTITLRVSDGAATGEATAPGYVVVYDPTGSFVTGGGWITSPVGACASSVCGFTGEGKATFGFVSKYQKGATLPSGATQFEFSAGGLAFASTSYQWLTVAGPLAQFKGTGTVNGAAGYQFLVTAVDGAVSGGGGVDRFRIKIWNADAVVYDNQAGAGETSNAATALGGGSIVIHK